ncbi:hypothetical protein nbrc107696_32050 [Gordonia spumicola]|uniref:Uncharacterized protein n=2 Tax=Gordonia spumicola TaxID=589161 RepID=A0A7I9VBN2_9ACTN|nr:hypothetical protein nbrc107696_32050 [Gordonia spumicola]
MPTPKPPVAIGAAAVVSLVAFSVAALADSVLISTLAVVVGAGLVVWLVRSASAQSAGAGSLAVFGVPVLMLGIGTTVVAAVSDGVDTTTSWNAGSDETTAAVQVIDDPDGLLAKVLDRADTIAPHGSESILSITFRDQYTDLDVLDQRSGMSVGSSYRDGEWDDRQPQAEHTPVTFSRAELTGFDLAAVQTKAEAAVHTLGLDAMDSHPADGLRISRQFRQDRMLVADFTVAMSNHVEVDMSGRVADTLDAGSFDTMLASAKRAMAANGIDPARRNVGELQFKSLDETSSSISATTVQSSGGVAIDFDAGPKRSVVLVPGQFAEVEAAKTWMAVDEDTFALQSVTQSVLDGIRVDAMRRFNVAAYNKPRVGVRIGHAPGADDGEGATITIRIGPSSLDAAAVYSMTGEYLRDGTW